jgi:hypothetical protein
LATSRAAAAAAASAAVVRRNIDELYLIAMALSNWLGDLTGGLVLPPV